MKKIAVKQVRNDFIVQLWVGENTSPMSTLNFHAAGFAKNIAEAIARSFVALQGGNTAESQNANWRLLRGFGGFISENYGDIKKIPADCLINFGKYLASSGRSLRTTGAAYNAAYQVLQWLLRNAPETIDKKIRLERGQAASLAKSSVTLHENTPDAALLSRILNCCYTDIEASEMAREEFRLAPLREEPSVIADILISLLSIGGGIFPGSKQLSGVKRWQCVKDDLREYGGVRELYSRYHLSTKDLFPYYLSILIQASANPQSLRVCDMNCIVTVPFREDLERFVWDKQRSHRLQIQDFPKDKRWSAPNIARRLLVQNSELRSLAPLRYGEALFLCRTVDMKVSVPSWQTLHNCLKEFRDKHQLPPFHLSDLRRAGGVLHHKAGRSILSAQQRLQHKSTRTTQIYTPLSDRTIEHQVEIRKFQGLMLKEAESFKSSKSPSASVNEVSNQSAETLFGFQCKDPFAGIAEGSSPGMLCPKFHQCSGCSGSIVVVDDPHNVAKLIYASNHLIAERERSVKEGWSKRFDLLYQPTIDVLRNDIYPAISKAVWEKALMIAVLPLPRLE